MGILVRMPITELRNHTCLLAGPEMFLAHSLRQPESALAVRWAIRNLVDHPVASTGTSVRCQEEFKSRN